MPRVLFLNRFFAPDHSATSQIASDLAEDLAARGFGVTTITQRKRHDSSGAAAPPHESIGGVRVLRVWTTSFGRGWLPGRMLDYLSFYLSASARLFFEASRGTLIIAMTDPPLICIPAGAIARLRGAKLVNWLQDVFPEVAQGLGVIKQPMLLRVLEGMRNHALRRSAANVVIGNAMSNLVRVKSGGRPVTVIPNWALEEAETPPTSQNPLRKDWNLGQDFIVGYSGNLGRAHSLDALLGAAEALKSTPGIKFLFIGDGAQLPAMKARAHGSGLANVIFKPFQPREVLRQSLTLPDLHVVSLDERMEGLIVPSKFVGVIALGKPVLFLGAHDGEIGSWIAKTGCGVVAPAHDAPAIAATITRLAGDRAALAAMAASAHDLWRREFRRQRALDAWAQLLNSLDG